MRRFALVAAVYIVPGLCFAGGCGGADPTATNSDDAPEASPNRAEAEGQRPAASTPAAQSVKSDVVQRGAATPAAGAEDKSDSEVLASAARPSGRYRGNMMHAGDVLYGENNDYLTPDLWYEEKTILVMQNDCNLVVYQWRGWPGGDWQPYWNSGTWGRGSNCTLAMQTDGNLVIYNGTTPVWDSRTWGRPGSYLAAQWDGNMVMYPPNGAAMWATNTVFRSVGGGGGGGGGSGSHPDCTYLGTEATCDGPWMYCEEFYMCNGQTISDTKFCGGCIEIDTLKRRETDAKGAARAE